MFEIGDRVFYKDDGYGPIATGTIVGINTEGEVIGIVIEFDDGFENGEYPPELFTKL